MEEDKDQSHHSQEIEMEDSSHQPSSLVEMRNVKIKSITGITYELSVPKDVS